MIQMRGINHLWCDIICLSTNTCSPTLSVDWRAAGNGSNLHAAIGDGKRRGISVSHGYVVTQSNRTNAATRIDSIAAAAQSTIEYIRGDRSRVLPDTYLVCSDKERNLVKYSVQTEWGGDASSDFAITCGLDERGKNPFF